MVTIDQCSVRTYPKLSQHPPRLVAERPPFPIFCIWDGDVVIPRVCRFQDPGMHHEPRKELPALGSQDAVGLPIVVTLLHAHPVPAKVYNI